MEARPYVHVTSADARIAGLETDTHLHGNQFNIVLTGQRNTLACSLVSS